MSALREAAASYLALRRALGFGLVRDGKLLTQFIDYLEAQQASTVTVDAAIAWVRQPAQASPGWLGFRMRVVRSFAIWLSGRDTTCEIPPPNVLAGQPRRAVPYLYSPDEIRDLMDATSTLRKPLRQATYRTLIGLLAVTGMRIGEAITLDDTDLDTETGVLTVRAGKGSGVRLLPLQPSTTSALVAYQQHRDALLPRRNSALLVSPPNGSRLIYCNVANTFRLLTQRAGLTPRSTACRPRIHDLRHSFAVATLTDWYADGGDIPSRLPLLSTWLGHIHPKGTYWYLTGSPELLALVGKRLENLCGNGDRHDCSRTDAASVFHSTAGR
ncbi:MAG TPA: tyrosine-type recombinase/integrase [Amycolatopsis sp.]|nr:tyrosine-type recombinase/integrase [Amycolatopsis sp.]